MNGLPHSPSAQRNRGPVGEALQPYLKPQARILEFGSGTAEHALHVTALRPDISWQPTEQANRLGALVACVAARAAGSAASAASAAAGGQVATPRELDLQQPTTQTWLDDGDRYDVCFAANVLHIVAMDGVAALFGIAGHVLQPDGVLCLYGPVRVPGEAVGEGNRQFDASLRAEDARQGLRDLGELDAFASATGLQRSALIALPANNHLMVWQRSRAPA